MLKDYGWQVPEGVSYTHEWTVLRDNIQNHIKAINYAYNNKMREVGADYINAFASFENQN